MLKPIIQDKRKRMRIAIIGTGIAGNSAAYALATSSDHDITVFEKDSRPGGHSATVDIVHEGQTLAIDTGFIVYNEINYPNLTALFHHLDIRTHASDMSFSVSANGGRFEWCGRSKNVVDGLFAQRSNLFSPGYLRMLLEVGRFNREARADLEDGRLEGISLGAYLVHNGYSRRFCRDYLLPMGAAIWSMAIDAMLNFPARSFVTFFRNHHLMQFDRPVWRTVTGGSRVYVQKMVDAYRDRLRLNSGIRAIKRRDDSVSLTLENGTTEQFDSVIVAAHSNEALAMLADPTPDERAILGSIAFKPNDVYLHRDPKLMPVRKRAWAAWNVMQGERNPSEDLCVTYWMNALQSIDDNRPVFVTLNPPQPPRPELTFGRFSYDHPQFNEAAISAQGQLGAIQGRNRTWFCGAWTRYGFHEDGILSGLDIAERFGAVPRWRPSSAFAEAAE